MEKLILVGLFLFVCFCGFTRSQRVKILDYAGWRCEDCGKSWDKDKYMLECHHVVPLGDGGKNTVSNSRLLCRPCHAKAHRRLGRNAKDRATKNRNYRAARLIEKRIKQKGVKRYGY